METSKSLQNSLNVSKNVDWNDTIANNETLIGSSVIYEDAYPDTRKTQFNEEKIVKALPYNYKDDPSNPKSWPKNKKAFCLAIVLINSFIPYFSSSIYIPATHDMMIAFNIDLTAMTSTFSLYLLMCGFMPLYWAPLSQRVGRKWVYVIGMFIYTVSSVLCAISTNFVMFYVFRVLQAIFGCSALGLGGGTVSDIAEPHERGKLMSYYIFSLVISSPIGTIIGGFIDEHLGFRSIFYLLAIYGGLTTVITFLFLEETLYTPNVKRDSPSSLKELLILIFAFNPLKSLVIIRQLNVFLAIFQVSIPFGCYYFFVASLSPTFSVIYHFTPKQIGLCFIGGGIGSCLGSIVPGHLSDKYCAKVAAKNNGMVIGESRLRLIFYVLPLVLSGTLMYGWFLSARFHWIAPVIAFAISAFGIMFVTTIIATYLVDANPSSAASAIALNTFARSLSSMIFSLASVKMRATMGDGWTYTLLGSFSALALCICTPLLVKYGKKWRSC